MKRNLLFLICLLITQMTFAGVVPQEEAQQKAMDFLAKYITTTQSSSRLKAAKVTDLTPVEGMSKRYHVFNVGLSEGYIIVSGDDRAPAILGYATQGTFNPDNMPENMKAWLKGYADQLAYLESHPNAAVVKAPKLDEHPAIYPMLTSTWNQGAPYNLQCPKYNNETTATGCVATAMAQVINYHKHPSKTTTTIPSYTTSTRKLDVSAINPTTIDWDNMLDQYTGSETTAQKNAVATLMKMCGASVGMDYNISSVGGSGARTMAVAEALYKYFDYDESVHAAMRDSYRANSWNNLIYHELENNRPVLYGGQSSGGGHAFVIDGYLKEGLFHVNWGWGGSSDSYFLLSVLDPDNNSGIGASSSSDGFSFSQDATIGVKPKSTEDYEEAVLTTFSNITLNSSTPVTKTNDVFNISITAAIFNLTGKTRTFDYGLGVFDKNTDQLVYAEKNYYGEFPVMSGNYNAILTAKVKDLADGDYIIVPISREKDTETWYKNEGSDVFFIPATISGNTMTLQKPTVSLNATIDIEGQLTVGTVAKLKITIENQGSFFCDQLFILSGVGGNNYMEGGRYFELEEGATDVLEMNFTPQKSGTNMIYLRTPQGNIQQKSVNVAAAKSYTLSFSNGKVTNATDNIIKSSTAQIQVDIKNESSDDYVDEIMTCTMVPASDNKWSSISQTKTAVNIKKDETKTVDIEVSNLSDGRYWFIILYKSGGEYISLNNGYKDIYNYQVVLPTTPDAELIAAYNEALQGAKDALDGDDYANITGEERTQLTSAISTYGNPDNTSTAYKAAVNALTTATTTFKTAKAAYDEMVALLAYVGSYKYASTAKTNAVNAIKGQTATSAADAKAKTKEWAPLVRQYAESSALLEGIAEQTDWTIVLKNSNASNGINYWNIVNGTGSEGTVSVLSGEPLTDGDGKNNYSYFEGGNTSASAWDVSFEQEVMLPKGKFLLTVSSRASAELSTFTLYANKFKTEMPHIGNTAGLFGNGWNDASLEFELSADTPVKIGVQGVTTSTQNWMSFTRFRLVQFDSSQPTGINQVDKDADNKAVYNLRGQKVSKARKGLYIIRSGQGKGKKVVVR